MKLNNIIIYAEIQEDCRELTEYGLSAEEITGYIEFFLQNWADVKENVEYEN